MNINPLVSIVIPIYNAEKYLKDCLESILKQTYKNYEIIAVNDGSTDKSRSILEKFLKIEKRIKIINLKNSGVSNARNVGIEMSKGDYICFVDSDDLLSNIFLESLIKMDFNKYDLVQCNFMKFTEKMADNKIRKIEKYNENDIIREIKKIIHKFSNEKNNITISVWGKIYKKSIILDNNIRFNNRLYKFEDGIFNLRYLSYCSQVCVVDSDLYGYRINNNMSLSQKLDKNKLEQNYICIDELKDILSFNYKCTELDSEFNFFVYDSILSYFDAFLFRKDNLIKKSEKKKKFKELMKNCDIVNSLNQIDFDKMNIKEKIYFHSLNKTNFNEAKFIYNLTKFFRRR